MKNYTIDWKNLTEEEAQVILDGICGTFNVLAKTWHNDQIDDVSFLVTCGLCDDNFHAKNFKLKCEEKPQKLI